MAADDWVPTHQTLVELVNPKKIRFECGEGGTFVIGLERERDGIYRTVKLPFPLNDDIPLSS